MMDSSETEKNVIIDDRVAENITRVEELAYELKIHEVMATHVRTLKPDQSMQEVVDLFRTQRISGAPVLKDDKLVGILSIEDIIRCLIKSDLASPVSKYMTSNVMVVHDTDPALEAIKIFVSATIGRLPVLDSNDKLVGIITKGDITRGTLNALQRDYQAEEVRRYRARHLFEDIESERSSLILRYTIQPKDFTKGGAASTNIKRALLRLGASPQMARRTGIAVYEAEMNLIIHTTNGGVIRVEIEPKKISIDAYDDGPGIADVNMAMKAGYSTASEETRELGFGAGMGLVNISRCVDNMVLESVPGKGTRLKMRIFLDKEQSVGEGYPNQQGSNPA
jgi:CBS domain-containing protein/anti-sigma regulatory factor (Ser/Thr protein kinase)